MESVLSIILTAADHLSDPDTRLPSRFLPFLTSHMFLNLISTRRWTGWTRSFSFQYHKSNQRMRIYLTRVPLQRLLVGQTADLQAADGRAGSPAAQRVPTTSENLTPSRKFPSRVLTRHTCTQDRQAGACTASSALP